MKPIKISFCTTCMNRLHHLKETLIKNLIDNTAYQNLEFILLDYNSTDGLESYIKKEMLKYIKSGDLVYYKTLSPKFYNMSHSRNLAFKLATGDIVCNIDADNFTGKDFADYIYNRFKRNKKIFLTTNGLSNEYIKKDVLGRICVRKEDFIKVGGYDEKMLHYGFDDNDIVTRLERFGLKKVYINESSFLHAIKHSNEERISHGVEDNNLLDLLVRYITPVSSELIFIFRNNQYRRGIVENNFKNSSNTVPSTKQSSSEFEYSLRKNKWEKGEWKKGKNILELNIDQQKYEILKFTSKDNKYSLNKEKLYYVIKDPHLIHIALFFYNQISNRIIMENNIIHKKIIVNENGFGNDVVYKNFSCNPISL